VCTFTEDEFGDLCAALCQAALHQNNLYYIVDICIDLIGIFLFFNAFS
jgi:hypothetical protein